MFKRVCFLAIVLLATRIEAQETSAISTIERLAVREALSLSSRLPASPRVVIDPMIVHPNEAPGSRDSVRREDRRNSTLIQAFGARSLPRASVVDCSSRPCTLRDADILVTLSEPAIQGMRASITVTTLRVTPRGTQYRTVNILFEKRAGVWEVVGRQELGMS
jgi:hypothetical protein